MKNTKLIKVTMALALAGVVIGTNSSSVEARRCHTCIGHGVKVASSGSTLSNQGPGMRVICIGGGQKVAIADLGTVRTGNSGSNSGPGMRLICIGGGQKVSVTSLVGNSGSNSGPGMRLRCIGHGVKVLVSQ